MRMLVLTAIKAGFCVKVLARVAAQYPKSASCEGWRGRPRVNIHIIWKKRIRSVAASPIRHQIYRHRVFLGRCRFPDRW